MKEKSSKSKRITAYKALGFVGFLSGAALLPVIPIGGLLLWSSSLVPMAKATEAEKKYKSTLEEYKQSFNNICE